MKKMILSRKITGTVITAAALFTVSCGSSTDATSGLSVATDGGISGVRFSLLEALNPRQLCSRVIPVPDKFKLGRCSHAEGKYRTQPIERLSSQHIFFSDGAVLRNVTSIVEEPAYKWVKVGVDYKSVPDPNGKPIVKVNTATNLWSNSNHVGNPYRYHNTPLFEYRTVVDHPRDRFIKYSVDTFHGPAYATITAISFATGEKWTWDAEVKKGEEREVQIPFDSEVIFTLETRSRSCREPDGKCITKGFGSLSKLDIFASQCVPDHSTGNCI